MTDDKLDLRAIAASNDLDRVVASTRHHGVRLFDLHSGLELSSFNASPSFGGSRLAISPSGQMVAAANYDSGSVTLFNDAGRPLWTQNGLNEIQVVSFSTDSQSLYCSHHRGTVSVFDSNDGNALRFTWWKKQHSGSYRLFESPYDDRFLNSRIESSLQLMSKSLRPIATIKRKTFAVLDAAFAPEFLCVAETGGPITCYHIDGTEVWECPHEYGHHAHDLAYANDVDLFLSISMPYDDRTDQFLLSIQPATGEVVDVKRLPGKMQLYFAANGKMLVSTDGTIYRTEDIAHIGSLKLK